MQSVRRKTIGGRDLIVRWEVARAPKSVTELGSQRYQRQKRHRAAASLALALVAILVEGLRSGGGKAVVVVAVLLGLIVAYLGSTFRSTWLQDDRDKPV